MDNLNYVIGWNKSRIEDLLMFFGKGIKYGNINDYYKSKDINVGNADVIIKSFNKIAVALDMKAVGLKLFFTERDDGKLFIDSLLTGSYKDINSIEEFIEFIDSYDRNELLEKMISFYDKDNFTKNFYSKIVADKEMLVRFLNGLNIETGLKWEIMSFISISDVYMESLREVFTKFAMLIEEEYRVNAAFLSEFESKVNKQLTVNGLDNLIEGCDDLSIAYEKGSIRKLNLVLHMFMPCTVDFKMINEESYLFMGFEYEKALSKKKLSRYNNGDFNYKVFKAFSDATRISIIKLVNENKNLCATEIADRLSVPLSTLSHHFDVLCTSGVLDRWQDGKKSIFSLNMETVEETKESLKKLFS